ncbi:hypothetical protein QQ045_002518 [Rhodiola kirilowii]
MERKGLGFFFFLLLIFLGASQEKSVMMAEAKPRQRVCQSASHGYHGPCLRNHNCALVCRNEGFSGGECNGFRRRCFCTKLC